MSMPLGLTFAAANGGPLPVVQGQGPVGEMFAFDLVAVASTTGIDMIGVDVAGGLESFLNGQFHGDAPYLGAMLGVSGAGSPFSLIVGLSNLEPTTITCDDYDQTQIAHAPALTLTAPFQASGLSLHFFSSLAAVEACRSPSSPSRRRSC
jgi:hypothetical protein